MTNLCMPSTGHDNQLPSAGDGVFAVVGSDTCVLLSDGSVSTYTKKRTVAGGVVTQEVWVSDTGAETLALPAGSKVIPCSAVVYPATSPEVTATAVSVEPIPMCDGVPFVRHYVYAGDTVTNVYDTDLSGMVAYAASQDAVAGGCPVAHPVVQYQLNVPEISNGQQFIELITPAILPGVAYEATIDGAYAADPLVVADIIRVDQTTYQVVITNQSGAPVSARLVSFIFIPGV